MTNYERIKKQVRKMTVEDMANALIELHFDHPCDQCIYDDNYTCNEDCNYGVKEWLNTRVKEKEDEGK